MASKVTELTRLGAGTPKCGPDCRVCHDDTTRTDRVSADNLWRWSLRNPGKTALKY